MIKLYEITLALKLAYLSHNVTFTNTILSPFSRYGILSRLAIIFNVFVKRNPFLMFTFHVEPQLCFNNMVLIQRNSNSLVFIKNKNTLSDINLRVNLFIRKLT